MSEAEIQDTGLNKRGRRRRRRRPEGSRRRGLYLLPHLFTTGNLFFGFFSIVQAMEDRFDRAALGIVLAIVFDGLDGRVARLTGSTSRFGIEYDSISDTVSCGVAPAILAFSAGNLMVLGRPGWVLAFLFTVCAALRLARFNLSPGRYLGRFQGLPSPAAAGLVASTQLFVSFLREWGAPVDVPEWLVAAGVVSLGLLMVSGIPYRTLKELDLRHSFGTLVLVVLVLLLVVVEPKVTLFAVGIFYVAAGPVEWLYRWLFGKPLQRSEVAAVQPSQGETG